ncbi:MAG TPA: hypothetical protein VK509_07960 [Polyangiales bacterium]|nr:hypothetical protein [Polyangiales bacterium]
MNVQPGRWTQLVLAVLACGCEVPTSIGNACPGGVCADTDNCGIASQQFPDNCNRKARTCHQAEVPPDVTACDSCMGTLARLNIGADVGPCACTYCAVQLRGCFESAEYELHGDSRRDADCRKIVECGWANDCASSDCYCGHGVDRDTCLREANAGNAAGPCAALIEALVECEPDVPLGTCIFANQQTGDSVLQRATEVGLCVTGDPLLPTELIEAKCPLVPADEQSSLRP